MHHHFHFLRLKSNSQQASITSKPLFISVARIDGDALPIFQVG